MWFLSVQDKKPEEIEMLRGQLWIPPAGVPIDERSPWHPANQLKNLQRVKQGPGSSVANPPRAGR